MAVQSTLPATQTNHESSLVSRWFQREPPTRRPVPLPRRSGRSLGRSATPCSQSVQLRLPPASRECCGLFDYGQPTYAGLASPSEHAEPWSRPVSGPRALACGCPIRRRCGPRSRSQDRLWMREQRGHWRPVVQPPLALTTGRGGSPRLCQGSESTPSLGTFLVRGISEDVESPRYPGIAAGRDEAQRPVHGFLDRRCSHLSTSRAQCLLIDVHQVLSHRAEYVRAPHDISERERRASTQCGAPNLVPISSPRRGNP